MANSDYTYDGIVGGKGSYIKESPQVYVAGVETLQKRLNNCGYGLTVDGKFGTGTETAVKAFQKGCGLTVDGHAGPNTLKQLDKVYQNSYFTQNNVKFGDTAWGRSLILTGVIPDVDLLAIVIFREDTKNADAQKGVAQVIKNRTNSSSSTFIVSSSSYPNASKWARVIGAPTQYSPAADDTVPDVQRGLSSASDGINPLWKSAVDIAKTLVNNTLSVPLGYTVTYTVSGSTVTLKCSSGKTTAVTNQTSQTNSSMLKDRIKNGGTATDIIAYESDAGRNVMYNYS